MPELEKIYKPIPTLQAFHESGAQMRAIVGPVGSGKTTAAAWELCYYLPFFLLEQYGIKKTRWVVVRNTLRELIDTTQRTVFDWFDWGTYKAQPQFTYLLKYPTEGVEVELLFRSCDIDKHIRQFKSLELTGYWIDESIETKQSVTKMLKNRIGRYPRKCPVRFGIETTNPPEIEHPLYWQFDWQSPPPGPVPNGKPLINHAGFWQPPRENEINLRPGYYDDLVNDYADDPDWVAMYVDGKPGVLAVGKQIYNNFQRVRHVAKEPLKWSGSELYRGWDNTGNSPAAVVAQFPTALQCHILKEFFAERESIVDFTNRVVAECNLKFPNAEYTDYADPAGNAEFSKKEGGFTSNARLMREECGVSVLPSEQNFASRINAVDGALAKYDGLLLDPSCTRLQNGFLGGYHYPEIGNTGTFSEAPKKNKYSHVHDSLQYLLVKVLRTKAKPSNMTKNKIHKINKQSIMPSMRKRL